MNYARTTLLAAALVVASATVTSAGVYDDAVVRTQRSIERSTAKLAAVRACAAIPAPCAAADLARAQRTADRAAKKLELAKSAVASSR